MEQKGIIVGVTGFIGSGKDTVADYLVNFHEFRRESFAASLKDAVSAVFGWDRTLLEGRTKEARDWREQQDEWWTNRLDMKITPRWVLQNWGTEVCRASFHDDIWIASVENKLRKTADNVVISDARFPNELTAIKKTDGILIRVNRGELPSWYDIGIDAAKGNLLAIDKMKELGVHTSEWAWLGSEFNAIIDNNGTIDELYNQVWQAVISQL